jgi:hypothetical protein
MFGLSIIGGSGSDDIVVIGREFITAETSAMSVDRTSWVSAFLCVVEEAIKSDDNLVRKAVVRIYHEGKHVSYTRPITELVLLLEE